MKNIVQNSTPASARAHLGASVPWIPADILNIPDAHVSPLFLGAGVGRREWSVVYLAVPLYICS